ncbi:MAG: 16S rRNA (adenine(1518)-N(6)/adenine(1519)-N(6))-dimethyltransferase RsmA [Ruminococcus sp.]|nr:16S rRNA (adenine(1518)-N(6)/adenine(1519)-N(6))-dimethyltransferase RsmA [Ruminococcus sp.]
MEQLTNISVIQALAEKHGFSFSKGLGQNFLINPSVCPRIAEMGGAEAGCGVLEIGTGFGVLTAELAKRADKVAAVEINTRLLPVLDETLSEFDNVKIINQDILKTDVAALLQEEFGSMPVSVCANLPYYITSPILMLLLESRLPITAITVMVQKETAQRLCAPVGTRESGAITVAVHYYGEPRRLFDVSRGSFMPAPKVDSAVIRIDVRKQPLDPELDEEFFFRMVRAGFSQRRKTIANSLGSMLNLPKETVYSALRACDLAENARIESLNMEELIGLAKSLKG